MSCQAWEPDSAGCREADFLLTNCGVSTVGAASCARMPGISDDIRVACVVRSLVGNKAAGKDSNHART